MWTLAFLTLARATSLRSADLSEDNLPTVPVLPANVGSLDKLEERTPDAVSTALNDTHSSQALFASYASSSLLQSDPDIFPVAKHSGSPSSNEDVTPSREEYAEETATKAKSKAKSKAKGASSAEDDTSATLNGEESAEEEAATASSAEDNTSSTLNGEEFAEEAATASSAEDDTSSTLSGEESAEEAATASSAEDDTSATLNGEESAEEAATASSAEDDTSATLNGEESAEEAAPASSAEDDTSSTLSGEESAEEAATASSAEDDTSATLNGEESAEEIASSDEDVTRNQADGYLVRLFANDSNSSNSTDTDDLPVGPFATDTPTLSPEHDILSDDTSVNGTLPDKEAILSFGNETGPLPTGLNDSTAPSKVDEPSSTNSSGAKNVLSLVRMHSRMQSVLGLARSDESIAADAQNTYTGRVGSMLTSMLPRWFFH